MTAEMNDTNVEVTFENNNTTTIFGIEEPVEVNFQNPNVNVTVGEKQEVIVNFEGTLDTANVKRLKWVDLAITWTEEPSSEVYSGINGEVFSYVYGSTTYYRFVPIPYESEKDRFYTTYNDPSLSGLVAIRGKDI